MIVVLSGGVGGARLCAGLVQVFDPSRLLVVVNTGDDFDHWGLRICPDLDTVMYTLSGQVNEAQGWGIEGDTWRTLEGVEQRGGPSWFRLGDQDLTTHLARTALLSQGMTLSQVTRQLFGSLGVQHPVVPVTDDTHRTWVDTDAGLLAFQDYFVRLRCEPRFFGVRFQAGPAPKPSPALAAAMASPDVEAVLVCPSNPVLSIEPILAVAGVRDWLSSRRFPVLAVSPFLAGAAVKGPAGKIFAELGLKSSVSGLIDWYGDLVDGWLVEPGDMLCAVPSQVQLRAHHIRLGSTSLRREVAVALAEWISELKP